MKKILFFSDTKKTLRRDKERKKENRESKRTEE